MQVVRFAIGHLSGRVLHMPWLVWRLIGVIIVLRQVLMTSNVLNILCPELVSFSKAHSFEPSLDISNDHLVFVSLFLQGLYFSLELSQHVDGVDIIVLSQRSVLLLQPFEHAVVFLHFRGKLIVHLQYYSIFLVQLIPYPVQLFVDLMQRCLRL